MAGAFLTTAFFAGDFLATAFLAGAFFLATGLALALIFEVFFVMEGKEEAEKPIQTEVAGAGNPADGYLEGSSEWNGQGVSENGAERAGAGEWAGQRWMRPGRRTT